MPIGKNWRHGRARRDLSSQQAADQLGIKQKTLLNIESNQVRAVVSERLAYRAARLYGVQVTELVVDNEGGEGVPDDPPSKDGEQETNVGPGRGSGSGGGTGPGKGGKGGPKRLTDRAVA